MNDQIIEELRDKLITYKRQAEGYKEGNALLVKRIEEEIAKNDKLSKEIIRLESELKNTIRKGEDKEPYKNHLGDLVGKFPDLPLESELEGEDKEEAKAEEVKQSDKK